VSHLNKKLPAFYVSRNLVNVFIEIRQTDVRVAVRSKAWVCGRQPVEIAGSNPPPTAWMSHSFASLVCCQVGVFATGRSLVQRSPNNCGVSLCVIVKPR